MDAFKLLWPHIQNLANLHVTKFVDTGDRMYDTCLIGIIMVIISLFSSYIPICYKLIKDYYNIINHKEEDIFNPLDINENDYDMNTLSKYNFSYHLVHESLFADEIKLCNKIQNKIIAWIEKTYGTIMCEDPVELCYRFKNVECVDVNKSYKIKMPILRYIKDNKFEYIFYSNNRLYSNDLNKLTTFIKGFDLENQDYLSDEKYIFEIGSKGGMIKRSQVNKNKTFNKLHFDKKEELLELLKKFKSGTLYNEGLSLDNKLGLLFYGPQGTAKTGTCTAIANYLDRHILLLNSLITAPREKILDIIDKCRKTHVIVLDEADYILKRTVDEGDEYNNMLLNAKTIDETLKIKECMKPIKKSEMSDEEFLLKMLDSFGDDTDRIILMNTNNPKEINPSYLRPGRIDFIGYFGYCSMSMFRNIAFSTYNKIDGYMIIYKDKIEKILKLNITPLILINSLVLTKTFEEVLEKLSLEKQANYIHAP